MVSVLTFSSIKITWNRPSHPNGDLKYYNVNFKVNSLDEKNEVVTNISVDQDSYTITNLKPYTNYTVYVTVTNNAKDPDSNRSNIVQTRTFAAPPVRPLSPTLDNRQFTAPNISDSSGPIKYVDIIIYHGLTNGSALSEEDIPHDNGTYKDWYIKRYTWKDYESKMSQKANALEDVLRDVMGEEQPDGKNLPIHAYVFYIRVLALNSSGVSQTRQSMHVCIHSY
jgi:hypothetical protein